jgi:6-phosphofructokinase 1
MNNKASSKFGVLTCGGVCPGMNDVVRSITLQSFAKDIRDVSGFKYGFMGLHDPQTHPIVRLNPDVVGGIHKRGGTFLGTSRERLDPVKAMRTLQEHDINTLFIIGGNGGNAAAAKLHDAITAEKLPIKVIGLPKSIDNDIDLIDRCFGFDTAVHEASKVLEIARNEGEAVPRGIVVVKVMGRHSGFIAHHALGADIRLIPENPMTLDDIFLQIESVLSDGRACVICVAEGFPVPADSLVNLIQEGIHNSYVKFINPSYILRGCETTVSDHNYCNILGAAAVEAAMDGRSGITIATRNGKLTYFDTHQIVKNVKRVKV